MKIYKTAKCSQIIFFFPSFLFFSLLICVLHSNTTLSQQDHGLITKLPTKCKYFQFSVDTFIFWFLKPETCHCISFPLPIEAHKRLLTHTNTSQHFLRKIYTYKICYKLAHKKYTRFCSVKSSLRFLLVTTLDSIYKAR